MLSQNRYIPYYCYRCRSLILTISQFICNRGVREPSQSITITSVIELWDDGSICTSTISLLMNAILHVSKGARSRVLRLPARGGHLRDTDTWGIWPLASSTWRPTFNAHTRGRHEYTVFAIAASAITAASARCPLQMRADSCGQWLHTHLRKTRKMAFFLGFPGIFTVAAQLALGTKYFGSNYGLLVTSYVRALELNWLMQFIYSLCEYLL